MARKELSEQERQQIKTSLEETRKRRKNQFIKVVELKVNCHHTSKIAYKTTLVKVSAKNTSKTCHTCGYVNPKVILGVEKWKCPVCSFEHHRDINATLNILNKGVTSLGVVGRERAENTNACGVPRSTAKQENELTSTF